MLTEIINKLSEPFDPRYMSWKPGNIKKDGTKCLALAYADLRAYMRRLDEVCAGDWSVTYEPWGNDRLICRLTIAGTTRSSTGEMSAANEATGIGGTVAEAQAFKRACAMFGLGRYIYELPDVWIDFDGQFKRITNEGKLELERRYRDWYARTIEARCNARKAASDTHDVDFPESEKVVA